MKTCSNVFIETETKMSNHTLSPEGSKNSAVVNLGEVELSMFFYEEETIDFLIKNLEEAKGKLNELNNQ